MMRSDSISASCRLCVTISAVVGRADQTDRSRWRSRSAVRASSETKGSSRKSTAGSTANALAIATLRGVSALSLPQAAFEAGVANAEWPARMQRLTQGSLIALVPPGSELWLDGSHNPDGGRATASALADIEERVPRPLVLVVGMLATKDATGFLGNFAGLARRVIAIPIAAQPNAMTADAVADVAKAAGIPAWRRDSLEDALAAVARLDLEPAPRIVITGSLYLAGEVLQANGTPPE